MKIELRKVFAYKIVIITFICLLLFSCYTWFSQINHNTNPHKYKEIYNVINGPINQDALDYAEQFQSSSTEGYLVTQKIAYLLSFNQSMKNVTGIASENYQLFSDQYSSKIISTYQNHHVDTVANTFGWQFLFGIHSSDFFILIIICLIASNIFTQEKENKVSQLLLTSKNGVRKLVVSKLLTITLIVTAIQFMFTSLQLLLTYYFYSLDGLTLPIYSIPSYQFSMFNISILTTFIWLYLIKWLALMFFSFIFCLLSSLTKKSIIALISGIAIILFLTYAYDFNLFTNIFNPISLLQAMNYFTSFEVINFVNQLIPTLYLAISFTIFITFTCTLLIVWRGKKCF